MSKTLSTQEVAALQEVPDMLEMGELRKITTLQDIPLTTGVSMRQLKTSPQKPDDDNERKLKSNSLKRFFHIASKKKLEEDSLQTENSEINFKEEGHKELSGSFSKSTLKSSLNSYWNSMFKQKRSGKSSKSKNDSEQQHSNYDEASSSFDLEIASQNLQNNEGDPVDKSDLQEIQNLNISAEKSSQP